MSRKRREYFPDMPHKMIKNKGDYSYGFQNKNRCPSHKGAHLYCCVRALCILLIVLLFVMFGPGHTDKKQTSHKQYTPGTYTSTLTLNNTNLEVEVSVDSSRINSIRFANLDETVTTMFPLIQPAIEEIADQIYDTQSLDAVELSDDAPYTSQIILNAIRQAVEKAAVNKTAASCISLIVFYPSTIR